MINVLITVKPSERFPNKNRLLARYTIIWLMTEMANINEDITVYTVGYRSELPDELPNGWKHIEYHHENHQKVLEYAENHIDRDIFVLAQVTQPVRRKGLLKDVIESVRNRNCTITAVISPIGWRVLDDFGRFNRNALLIDGALYGWKRGEIWKVFDKSVPHSIVLNGDKLVDIDREKDIPDDLETLFLNNVIDE